MLNYMKSEWYRIVHGREVYLFTGVLCAIVLTANLLMFAFSATPDFPYATVRYSLSNLSSSLGLLFLIGGLLVWFLFGEDRRNGTLKNALAHGCSRRSLFVGKCLVAVAIGCVSMVTILVVYVGSAVLLLEGPAAEPVTGLIKGVLAALPSTVAAVVLAVACAGMRCRTTISFLVWIMVISAVPAILHMVGTVVGPVATLSSWLPMNLFNHEMKMTFGGYGPLWDQPLGWAKALVGGFTGIAVFAGFGLWRAGKTEL